MPFPPPPLSLSPASPLSFFSQNFTIEPRIMWGENLMASRTSPARNSRPVERKNEETSTRGGSKTNVAVHSWKSSSRILLSLSLSPHFGSFKISIKILSTFNIIINKFLLQRRIFQIEKKIKFHVIIISFNFSSLLLIIP